MTSALDEIVYTLGRVQAELEDLAVGGLRAGGAERAVALDAIREDLARAGAQHLADRLGRLTDAIRAGNREAAAALMRTLAGLRVFERVLTLETVAARLSVLAASAAEGEDV